MRRPVTGRVVGSATGTTSSAGPAAFCQDRKAVAAPPA
ncbi:Uncharacterised protein [Mycobacteroides abscessus subsp. abscessus]|nr:Uncharacterised protein [Mycobacteroides abscessus subsp. abscessus]